MPALPKTWSLDSILNYAWGVEAGLIAFDESKDLAPKWSKHIVTIRGARDARDSARQKTAIAEARQRVFDAALDAQFGHVSGLAFLAADQKAGEEPYASMFGTVTAKDAQGLGAVKATKVAADLVAVGTRLGHPTVLPALPALAEAAKRLAAAATQREDDTRAEQLLDVDRGRVLAATETLAGETEIDLLKAFFKVPGGRELVRSILGVQRPAKKAAPVEDEPKEG